MPSKVHLSGHVKRPAKKVKKLALFWLCLPFVDCFLEDKVAQTNVVHEICLQKMVEAKKHWFPVYMKTVKWSFPKGPIPVTIKICLQTNSQAVKKKYVCKNIREQVHKCAHLTSDSLCIFYKLTESFCVLLKSSLYICTPFFFQHKLHYLVLPPPYEMSWAPSLM